MQFHLHLSACLVALLAVSTASMAQDYAPGAAPGTVPEAAPTQRYELKAQGEGFVRLDRQTGEMSFCTTAEKTLACRVGGDEREAYENELSALRLRVDALEEKIAGSAPPANNSDATTSGKRQDRVGILPEGQNPQATPKSGESELSRTQEEFDRAMDMATKAMRRFFDVIKDLRNDLEKG